MKKTLTQSRTKNSTRNTFFAALSYVVKILCQFLVRAVFIRYFIAEYLGINGLFTNVLNVLSLAELGIGNAIVYSMYKPVAEGDTEKIKSLVRLYRNIYYIIAAIVITIGLSLIPALPYLINDVPNVDINLTWIYILYLSQTVIGYFFAYRRSLVFANQRNDIESKVSFFIQILLAVTQISIICLLGKSDHRAAFYIYTAVLVVFNAVDALIVFIISYRIFPDIRGKAKKLDKEDTRQIVKNTSAMVCHRLGRAAVYSTDSIIISAYIGSYILGLYSNYTLVTNACITLVNLIITATKSSIGNYMATKKPEETLKLYKALNMAMMIFISFIAIGLFVCFQDFIALYSGRKEYKLSFLTMALIVISFFIRESRWMTISFRECAGLFWNDRYKALFEAGVNLGLDFLFVHFWGINGVILATIISTIAVPLWVEPYVLYKNYFKKSMKEYFLRYLMYVCIMVFVGGIAFGVCYFIPSGGFGWFLLKFVVCVIIPVSLFALIYFKMPESKYLIGVFKEMFGKKKNNIVVPEVVSEQNDDVSGIISCNADAGENGSVRDVGCQLSTTTNENNNEETI